MSPEFQWEGHTIVVDSRPVLKYLWMATETVVTVDGAEIGRSGGFGLHEKTVGTFSDPQGTHKLLLEHGSDLMTVVTFPYKLQIDGKVISQGRMRMTDWPLAMVGTVVIVNLTCCLTLTVIAIQLFFNR